MDDFERTLLTDNYLGALTAAPRHQSHEVSAEDYRLITNVLVSVLYEVTGNVRLRDEWKTVTAFEKPGPWPHAFRSTAKTGLAVSLTIDLGGIFFECRFTNDFVLPSMDDRFWRLLVELTLDYNAKYELTQWPSGFGCGPGEREISRARKSAVFSMIADFILAARVSDRDPPIGVLTFGFDWAGKWSVLTGRLEEITARAWQMSYMLYRVAYQRRREMEKRVRRQIERDRAKNPD